MLLDLQPEAKADEIRAKVGEIEGDIAKLITFQPLYGTVFMSLNKIESRKIPTLAVGVTRRVDLALYYNPDFVNAGKFYENNESKTLKNLTEKGEHCGFLQSAKCPPKRHGHVSQIQYSSPGRFLGPKPSQESSIGICRKALHP